ncbi:PREDICTED: uncharacterized protein K02A2.6-like [Vollenhovia emeryi]|uniref:uncharacterized protein K02A2.6-like n=1 Tax=Vollenhovia emeryi TaxID=411798 RepID=UPI0005F57C08|nr:PREDICTED: uncharacterized protein K02A2.6-like [Vollenhovia emeryi]
MKLLARSKVLWPLIDKDIERTVKNCEDCAKAGKTPIKCSLQPWSVPSGPWSRILIDYAGPMNGNYFLIMVDAYSKWPEVFRTNVTTTSRTIELILQAFAQHGHCDTIVSDNGPQFASMEFERFCKSLGVEHIRTAPYHPQSNGQAEKFVDLLKTGLKKAKGNIDQKLLEFLSCYRSTPSYGLGMKTPAEVLNGCTMKTRLDLLNPSGPYQGLADSKLAQQFNGHHGAKWKEFVEGDGVYYQLHRSNDSWEWVPATVIKKCGTVNYQIQTESGRVIKAHSNQLKLRHNKGAWLDTPQFLDAGDTSKEVAPEQNTIEQSQDDINQKPENRDDPETFEGSTDNSDVFEDALKNDEEGNPNEEEIQQIPDTRRHSTRSNFGVPPRRYGFDEFQS